VVLRTAAKEHDISDLEVEEIEPSYPTPQLYSQLSEDEKATTYQYVCITMKQLGDGSHDG
jgi:hypothetical protein